jgi:hypothetical protein
VWRRQVGLVRGTWWLAESSAGRVVARTTRWSHGRFHGWASKPRSSRDYVGSESWVEIGGGYTEFAGFLVVYQKPTVDPRSQDRRRRCSNIGPVWPVGTGLTGEEQRSDQCAVMQSGDFEAKDTHRDHKACVEVKQVCSSWASVRWCEDKVSQKALRGHAS